MERKVPCWISFLAIGTIAVKESFLNLAWLPRWEIKIKPSLRRTFTTWVDESSLGILQMQGLELGILYQLAFGRRGVFQIKFHGFF